MRGLDYETVGQLIEGLNRYFTGFTIMAGRVSIRGWRARTLLRSIGEKIN